MNKLKVDDDGIAHIDKFSGTTTDINIKNNHTRGCTVYVLYEILQGNISGIPKWETLSRAGIYLGYSPFYAGSVALVLNPTTSKV